MQNVMDDPIVKDVIWNPTRLAKDALVQRELFSGVMQSLFEVKRLSSVTKLVIKQAILMALVSGGSTTSYIVAQNPS